MQTNTCKCGDKKKKKLDHGNFVSESPSEKPMINSSWFSKKKKIHSSMQVLLILTRLERSSDLYHLPQLKTINSEHIIKKRK